MRQRRRGGNSKMNVQLSRTRARGAETRVRDRPAEPARRGTAGLQRARGAREAGLAAEAARRSRAATPARCHPSPPALRARRSVPLANHRAAAGSSRAWGSPWFPSPAVCRRCSRRASSGGRRVLPGPRRVSGHPSAHVALGHSTPEPPWGRAEGFQPRVLSPSTRFRLVGESLRP